MIAENSRLGNKNFTDNFFIKIDIKGNSTRYSSKLESWVVTDEQAFFE